MAWGSERSFGGVAEAADEYDCMLSPLLRRLHDGGAWRRSAAGSSAEVEGHFGSRADFAGEEQLASQGHRLVGSARGGIVSWLRGNRPRRLALQCLRASALNLAAGVR
jgi:hypothetical protein